MAGGLDRPVGLEGGNDRVGNVQRALDRRQGYLVFGETAGLKNRFGLVGQAVRLGGQVCKRVLVNLLEHLDPVLNISAVKGVLEAGGKVTTVFSNLGHARELLLITSGKVEERQLVEVPLLLVSHLDGLVVTVSESLGTESVPIIGAVQFAGHLNSDFKVATLKSKVETGLWVLDELQGNLWVPLLLQIRDDTLTD